MRFHSVGGWGAITTGKNLGAIIGDLNDLLYERDKVVDEFGNPKEIIHVSANPKYGSEKKGAPTAYFMVAAPERIRVNCDLRHVNVVLCCDPKAFTHCNPLDGMSEGGCLVWESEEKGEQAWERLPLVGPPADHREEDPRLHAARASRSRERPPTAPTSSCACRATRSSARSSPCRRCSRSSASRQEQFHEVVHKQYVKKFGRLGEGVVKSNMEVMTQGFERVQEIPIGEHRRAPIDRRMRGQALLPVWRRKPTATAMAAAPGADRTPIPEGQEERTPLTRIASFDGEFRSELRLQPAGHAATRRSASWPPAAATRRRSTSPAARRRSTSPRTARSAWSASPSVRTRRCPTARRISRRCCGPRSPTTSPTPASARRCSRRCRRSRSARAS